MLKTIFFHELQNHLYSLRFFFALVLTLLLFGTASVSYVMEYKEQKNAYEHGIAKLQVYKKNLAKNASNFAQSQNNFQMAPRNSGFIASCQEEDIPNSIIYSAFNVFGYEILKGNNNPFLLHSKNVNWEFIIVILFSFLAIVFTFDTISGEKEMRTMALCLSNSVSRGVIIAGKFFGTTTILSMFVLLGIIFSMFILLLSGQVTFGYTTLAEITGFFLLSVLLIACITSIGILTSVLSYRPNTSLLIGLLVWLVFMFVIPHSVLLLSNQIFPVEKKEVVAENCERSRKAIEASFPEGKWHSSGSNPFEPDHKIRANMHMEFMLGRKRIEDNYTNSLFNQYTSSSKLTYLSPTFIFEAGNEYILDAGFQRFKKNWDDLHTYQGLFLAWFKAFDAKDPKSPHWYNPFEDYSTSKKEIKMEDVPVYSERIVSFGQRISHGGVYVALLLLYTTIVFFLYLLFFL